MLIYCEKRAAVVVKIHDFSGWEKYAYNFQWKRKKIYLISELSLPGTMRSQDQIESKWRCLLKYISIVTLFSPIYGNLYHMVFIALYFCSVVSWSHLFQLLIVWRNYRGNIRDRSRYLTTQLKHKSLALWQNNTELFYIIFSYGEHENHASTTLSDTL